MQRGLSLLIALAVGVVTPFTLAGCGQSSTAPSGPSLSGVSLTVASVAPGGNGQGIVILTGPADAAGDTVTLSSSTTAVATVPASVTVLGGLSSAQFNLTAVGVGTTIITASFNGIVKQSTAFTVTAAAPVVLSAVLLSNPTVVGGQSVTGTVQLTGPAPSGGAAVTLSSASPITVPVSVTVPAGSSSATFTVATNVTYTATTGSVGASYGGVNASASLSVTQSPPIANFGVTGPETDTCSLTNSGTKLNCTFNGSGSTSAGTITSYDWTYASAKTLSQTTSGSALVNPTVDCTFVPPAPLPAGTTALSLTVTLVVHDSLGNTSAVSTHSGLRLLPQGSCGY
jgi:hypothetical protein